MESVKRYCDRAMLIRGGKVAAIGSPDDVANEYTIENFKKDSKGKAHSKHGDGLSDRVPFFKVTPVSKKVLTNEDVLSVDVEYEIEDDEPIILHIGIDDEIRNTVLINGGAKVKGKGRHKLRYNLPLSPYNDCNLRVYAVIDEERSQDRIAFTNEKNSYRCIVRNETGNYGLINVSDPIHGEWDGIEKFIYNRNKEMHRG